MTEQYFTNNPSAEHEYQQFNFKLRDYDLKFTTDSGVFSKQTIDYGTRAMLAALEFDDLPAGDLLDLGCGYGPVGITLAKETKRHIDMVDVNERAVDLAKQNAANNQVTAVDIFTSDIYQQVTKVNYAAIYTNPPIRAGKKVISQMLQQAPKHLTNSGQLWIVVQKKQGAASYEKIMRQAFGNAEIINRDKGYYVIKSVKTSD